MAAEKLTRDEGPGGTRLSAPDGSPEFSEHLGCGWIILRAARSWEEWRELAWMILETGNPDEGPPPA